MLIYHFWWGFALSPLAHMGLCCIWTYLWICDKIFWHAMKNFNSTVQYRYGDKSWVSTPQHSQHCCLHQPPACWLHLIVIICRSMCKSFPDWTEIYPIYTGPAIINKQGMWVFLSSFRQNHHNTVNVKSSHRWAWCFSFRCWSIHVWLHGHTDRTDLHTRKLLRCKSCR